jgi:hypothetical protein
MVFKSSVKYLTNIHLYLKRSLVSRIIKPKLFTVSPETGAEGMG